MILSEIVFAENRKLIFSEMFSQENECIFLVLNRFFLILCEVNLTSQCFFYKKGSGKTYTMGTGSCSYYDDEECGIIPRAVNDIFHKINVGAFLINAVVLNFISMSKASCKKVSNI